MCALSSKRESSFAESEIAIQGRGHSMKNGTLGRQESAATGAELSDRVAHNIETIAHLHTEAEGKVGRNQRTIEKLTESIGQPWALNAILGIVALWIVINTFGPSIGLPQVDPPPFQWLQGGVTLSALLVATMVLTTQNRYAKRAAHRGNLELQVNLVAEQKIAKLVSLLEELRRDLPSVRDRVDPIAEAMQESVDPHAVLIVLEETIELADHRLESRTEEIVQSGTLSAESSASPSAPPSKT
jgi:uncharacterized membrane protein